MGFDQFDQFSFDDVNNSPSLGNIPEPMQTDASGASWYNFRVNFDSII